MSFVSLDLRLDSQHAGEHGKDKLYQNLPSQFRHDGLLVSQVRTAHCVLECPGGIEANRFIVRLCKFNQPFHTPCLYEGLLNLTEISSKADRMWPRTYVAQRCKVIHHVPQSS